MYQLPKSRDLSINTCAACLEKQREIDRLREEVARLRSQLSQAERELRPSVIARKVSFGSQSEAGAKTREIWLTVLATLRKRVKHPQQRLKEVLDALARDADTDVLKLLWAADTS
jgi:septal ring factor EnvC (AmiA/AmiB activator)